MSQGVLTTVSFAWNKLQQNRLAKIPQTVRGSWVSRSELNMQIILRCASFRLLLAWVSGDVEWMDYFDVLLHVETNWDLWTLEDVAPVAHNCLFWREATYGETTFVLFMETTDLWTRSSEQDVIYNLCCQQSHMSFLCLVVQRDVQDKELPLVLRCASSVLWLATTSSPTLRYFTSASETSKRCASWTPTPSVDECMYLAETHRTEIMHSWCPVM